jgi:thioredoxin-like negative regulator of GroEL
MLSVGGASYAEAHREMSQTGRPLVVLVGADWCPGCNVMKSSSMPEVRRQGGLNGVAFATVNTDHERDLAQQLMGGGAIPQLIMYSPTSEGWNRRVLVGAQSPSAIQQFINQGVTAPPATQLGIR